MNIIDCVTVVEHANPDARCFRVTPRPGMLQQLEEALAVRIVSRLADPSATAFAAWTARRAGGAPHPAHVRAEIEAYVLADFGVPAVTDDQKTRLLGAVAEHLWAGLAPHLVGSWGAPLHVEHDHFSVIDHGGDGLSLYDRPPELHFRLWESKRHTSTTSVTSVVTEAGKQLKEHAKEYLARLSKVLQVNDDERIQQLSARLVTLWVTAADVSAVGVSVGKSSGAIPARPLQGLVKEFAFADAARYEGVVIEVPNLFVFAEAVRVEIMRGVA